MYKGRRIAVVVPAYNEETLIDTTLAGIPDYVDLVIAVDDASTDRTAEIVRKFAGSHGRVSILVHLKNQGVGATVVDGYRAAVDQGSDIAVVMAGDNQMDPCYLPALLGKIIDEHFDAAKGNRFMSSSRALSQMPRYRQLGNILLTLLTKAASGYWSLFDSQNGYYAISTNTLRRLDLNRAAHRYDFENSLLIQLNIIGARVSDVAIPARYGEEVSGIRLWRVAPRLLLTLSIGFFQRIYRKYFVYNFHPIALFIFGGILLMSGAAVFGVWAAVESFGDDAASPGTVMLAVLPFLMGFQLLLAGLVLDIVSEPH